MPALTLCPAFEHQQGLYIDRMTPDVIVVGLFLWVLIIEF